MKRKTINNRGSYSICRTAKRNPTGHDQKFCAYPGGPFAHLGFTEAIKAARTDAKRRRTQRQAPVAQPTVSTVSTATGLPHSVQLFMQENVDGEELQAAKKDPFDFVVKQLSALHSKVHDESLGFKRQIANLEEQVSGHERHILALNRSMCSIQATVHDMRSRGR